MIDGFKILCRQNCALIQSLNQSDSPNGTYIFTVFMNSNGSNGLRGRSRDPFDWIRLIFCFRHNCFRFGPWALFLWLDGRQEFEKIHGHCIRTRFGTIISSFVFKKTNENCFTSHLINHEKWLFYFWKWTINVTGRRKLDGL